MLTLPSITTTATDRVKLDSMAEVEITTTGGSGSVQYTITYELLLDGATIVTLTREKEADQGAGPSRVYGDIPNETWVDVPGVGPHVYTIRIRVTGTFITAALVRARALNALVFSV